MKNKKKSGGVLLMVMLMVLVISALTAGIFAVYTSDAVEVVYVDQSSQAYWLAESGLQRALDKLRTDKLYRDYPYPLSESVGNGFVDVEVKAAGVPDTWSLVSTGTVGNVSRIVSLDPYLYAHLGYGLMGLGGDSKLNQFGSVVGNIYSFGTLTVNGRSVPSIIGEVNALDTRNLDFNPLSGNQKVEMEIDPPISDFSAATGDAVSYIDIETTDASGTTVTNTYVDLTGGKVVKITGDYDFDNSKADGTYGNGTLIVDGNLTFMNSGNPFVIGDSGSIYVDGDIWAGKDGTFGQDVVVYASGSMSLQKAAGSGSTSLLVEGDLTVNKELDFNGFIFCEGAITVDGDLDLDGTLIAGEDFWLKSGYDVTYDPSEIPQYVLDNMIVYVTYATTPGTWNEIAAD